MIREFKYYIETNAVQKKTPNIALAKALLKKSELRFSKIAANQIAPEQASLVLEDAYEATREAAQSLMELSGFKPYSHEALIAFLREKQLLDISNIEKFNRYRILRNKSVYEAEQFSVETVTNAVDFAKVCIPKIKEIFLKKIGGRHG